VVLLLLMVDAINRVSVIYRICVVGLGFMLYLLVQIHGKMHTTDLPRIPRWRTFLNSFRLVRDPIPVMADNVRRYGPTYQLYLGGIFPAIFTQDPGFIQHVLQKNHRNYIKSPVHFDKLAHFLGRGLLTSEGQTWLRQRRLIQPGFHRQRLASLTEKMLEAIEQHVEEIEQRLEHGPVDMYREMIELTFTIIARAIFSQSVPPAQLDVLSHNITRLQEYVIKEIRQPFLDPLRKLNGSLKTHEKLRDENNAILMRYIEQRRASRQPHDDLLQMLLDARYEDTGEPMTTRQVLDEVTILFVAGHDTSANALSWLFYLLCQHPEAVTRIQEEIQTVLGDRHPTFSDLANLVYTRAAIEEAMRLYPPAWITDRMATNDDEYQGIFIPKGTYLLTYIYGVHHDARHWNDPESFRPGRFLPDQKNDRHSYAYIPFGGGPRLCIGNHFALMEMQLVVAQLLRRFTLTMATQEPIHHLALVTLRPREPMWMVK